MKKHAIPQSNALLMPVVVLVIACASSARAQFDSGSDGSDGQLFPSLDRVIDLSEAGSAPGKGRYDPARWAVIFNYTAVNIPAGVTVTFKNHPSGAPVVWLVEGDVTILGTVNLNGEVYYLSAPYPKPGPGGFSGGRKGGDGLMASAGFGPGGGARLSDATGAGASFGTVGRYGPPVYGNSAAVPLIGGSGGAGNLRWSGGAGGGALLIASSGTIKIDGALYANGGNGEVAGGDESGGGSGGTIRLIADAILGAGTIRAVGGLNGADGGSGRIRIEGDKLDYTGSVIPSPSISIPGLVFPATNAPSLRVASVSGQQATLDPGAGIETVDLAISTETEAIIGIEATNVPIGTVIEVRIVPQRGTALTVFSTALAGSDALSAATARAMLPPYRSEIQLRAAWIP